MIDWALFGALGFFIASLLAILIARPLWNRAVRLTTRRLEATMPMSIAEIEADKDKIRAEFAIQLRRMEVALEKAKDKAAQQLIKANSRHVDIVKLERDIAAAQAKLQEAESKNSVLEQTVRRRLPSLEQGLQEARDVIAELAKANEELQQRLQSRTEALRTARETVTQQRGEIKSLRASLEGAPSPLRRMASGQAELAKENQRLTAELARLKQELAESRSRAEEDELLRGELAKLASALVAAAGTRITAAAPTPLPAVPSEHGPSQTEALASSDANGGEIQPEAESTPEEFTPEEAAREETEEPRYPFARSKRGSLAERLENVEAEASWER